MTRLNDAPLRMWLAKRIGPELWLSASSVVSLIVPLGLTPVWARLFPARYFGVAAVLLLFPNGFNTWATLAYHSAIQTPSDDTTARRLAQLSMVAALAICTLVAAVCALWPDHVASAWLGEPGVRPFLWLGPVLIAGSCLIIVLDQYFIRMGRFRTQGIAVICSTLASAAVCALGTQWKQMPNPVALGAAGSILVGAAVRLVMGGWQVFLAGGVGVVAALRSLAWEYFEFPRNAVLSAFLASVSAQLPQLVISRSFSAETLGEFTRALAILAVPSTVLGRAQTAFLLREGGASMRQGIDARPVLRETLLRLVVACAPIYLVLGLFGPVLLPWFLGSKWQMAGQLSQPLALGLCASAIGSPLGALLTFGGSTHFNTAWQVARAGLLVAVLTVGTLSGSVLQTLWLWAVANALAYVSYGLLAWWAAKRRSEVAA